MFIFCCYYISTVNATFAFGAVSITEKKKQKNLRLVNSFRCNRKDKELPRCSMLETYVTVFGDVNVYANYFYNLETRGKRSKYLHGILNNI